MWPRVTTWKYVIISKQNSTVTTSEEEETPWLKHFVADPQACFEESFIVQINLWHPREACSLDKLNTAHMDVEDQA